MVRVTAAIRSTASRSCSEAYLATDPKFDGRVTVPVLWDKRNAPDRQQFRGRHLPDVQRRVRPRSATPRSIFSRGDRAASRPNLSEFIYENVNNGVYRRASPRNSEPTRRRCRALFAALDELEARLATRRYLFGDAHRRDGLAAVLHARPLRRGLSRALQVQPPPDRGLPESPRLPARPLPATRHRGDGELRSHQAALLRHARRHQSDAHRADRSGAGPHPPARTRAALEAYGRWPSTLPGNTSHFATLAAHLASISPRSARVPACNFQRTHRKTCSATRRTPHARTRMPPVRFSHCRRLVCQPEFVLPHHVTVMPWSSSSPGDQSIAQCDHRSAR